MTNLPHKFYPIIDSVEWIKRLLPCGVKFIQYRNKKQSDLDFIRNEIQTALDLGRDYNASVVINDYWQIAIEEGAEWIHLGQEDLQKADKVALQKANVKLGTSTHNEEELEYALSFDPAYVALGPVYTTISKKMVFEPQGLERVTQWKEKLGTIPLVGIGGIRLETAQAVLEAGADAVACIGDVTQAENPEERAQAWVRALI